MNSYIYKIVLLGNAASCEKEMNELASQGFRFLTAVNSLSGVYIIMEKQDATLTSNTFTGCVSLGDKVDWDYMDMSDLLRHIDKEPDMPSEEDAPTKEELNETDSAE